MNDPAERLPPLEGLLAELVEEEGGPGDHPRPERLLAYHAGRLGPEDEAALREHLAACRACARLVLDLAAFEEADQGAEPEEAADGAAAEPSSFEAAAAWRSLVPQLREEDKASGRPPRWLPWAAAAALLVAVAGLAWRVADHGRERAALEAELVALGGPQPDLPVLYLDQTTRGEEADESPVVELPRGGYLALVVLPPPEPWLDLYRVEVADGGGRVVWSGALAPSAEGGLRLGLPARLLPPGRYRVRLLTGAGDDADATPLAVYPLTVARTAE